MSDRFEQEKWLQERAFREQELALKERAQKVAEEDLSLRKDEIGRSRWRSPLVVAIFAAAAAALGNAVIAFVNGTAQQALEETRSESTRILEMIKTGNADKAAENLRFLIQTGLISDPNRLEKIGEYLAARPPGQGPTLPPPGSTGLQPTRTLPETDPLRPSTLAVGQLVSLGGSVMSGRCTAFRVAQNLIITASYCIDIKNTNQKLFFSPITKDGTAQERFEIDLDATEIIHLPSLSKPFSDLTLGIALLSVKNLSGASGKWLPMASNPPFVGQPLGAVAFLASPDQMVVRDPSCRVIEVKEGEFSHGCRLGGGSAGAPILTADGTSVLGVEMYASHPSQAQYIGWAARADEILANSKILRELPPPKTTP